MPLWNIVHSPRAFNAEQKKQLAEQITRLYTDNGLPAFYVCVLYYELPSESFFNGGKQTGNFVRILIDHVARRLELPEERQVFVAAVNQVIAPFVRDRGFNWEFQIDETPIELWSVQGFVPPPDHSAALERWGRENRPSAYTADEANALQLEMPPA